MGFILWSLLLFLVLHVANSSVAVNESSLNSNYSIYCLGLSVDL
jgi:hypothetical protein